MTGDTSCHGARQTSIERWETWNAHWLQSWPAAYENGVQHIEQTTIVGRLARFAQVLSTTALAGRKGLGHAVAHGQTSQANCHKVTHSHRLRLRCGHLHGHDHLFDRTVAYQIFSTFGLCGTILQNYPTDEVVSRFQMGQVLPRPIEEMPVFIS